MRNYILTKKEKEILRTFIEKGLRLNGFSVLTLRLKKARDSLKSDLELIDAALKKLEEHRG